MSSTPSYRRSCVERVSSPGWSTRARRPENEALTVGSLVIHEQNRSVSLDSQPLALTPTQYRLLVLLAKQPNVLVPLGELTQSVWNCEPDDGATSLIATQMARLRGRLRDGSIRPPAIVSVPSRGYRLLAA
jgi:two-component system response regulator RstA